MRKHRNSTLDSKYYKEIAQFTGLEEEQVKEVFKYYKLLLLFDIANHKKPKENITITLPCFTTLRLKPYYNQDGTQHLGIKLDRLVRKNRLSCLEEAYFNDKNYLTEYLMQKFSDDMKVQLIKELEDTFDHE